MIGFISTSPDNIRCTSPLSSSQWPSIFAQTQLRKWINDRALPRYSRSHQRPWATAWNFWLLLYASTKVMVFPAVSFRSRNAVPMRFSILCDGLRFSASALSFNVVDNIGWRKCLSCTETYRGMSRDLDTDVRWGTIWCNDALHVSRNPDWKRNAQGPAAALPCLITCGWYNSSNLSLKTRLVDSKSVKFWGISSWTLWERNIAPYTSEAENPWPFFHELDWSASHGEDARWNM